MIKRNLAIILVLSLGLTLVDCGNKDDKSAPTNNKTVTSNPNTDKNKDIKNKAGKEEIKTPGEIKEVKLSIYTSDDQTLSPIEITTIEVD